MNHLEPAMGRKAAEPPPPSPRGMAFLTERTQTRTIPILEEQPAYGRQAEETPFGPEPVFDPEASRVIPILGGPEARRTAFLAERTQAPTIPILAAPAPRGTCVTRQEGCTASIDVTLLFISCYILTCRTESAADDMNPTGKAGRRLARIAPHGDTRRPSGITARLSGAGRRGRGGRGSGCSRSAVWGTSRRKTWRCRCPRSR